ncbi:hypothetical protein BDQ17DRAFT_670783 [Cyathus striatus]|nr:hypothetical protein BDQ17DRAFT_670783 [Cyathus striatus]
MLPFTAILLLFSSSTSSIYPNVNALNVDTITLQTTTVKTYYPEPTTTLAPEWGQCGGTGWLGTTTCTSGTVCVSINEWYSQCQKVTPTISTSTVPTSSFPCPTVDCFYCNPGSTVAWTSTIGGCSRCFCTTTATTTTVSCPTYSCPSCPSGSYATQTAKGAACSTCTCAPYPTSTATQCPITDCFCSPGSTEIRTILTNGCNSCYCTASSSISSKPTEGSSTSKKTVATPALTAPPQV